MPRPNFYLLTTVLFWGFNFISIKIVYGEVSPPALLFGRFVLAWAVLALYCRFIGQPAVPPKEHRLRVWIGGFFSMGIYMVLFLEGTSRTGPAEAAIIMSTVPLLTGLLSNLVGTEKFSWMRLLATVVAFLGVSLVIIGRGGSFGGELVGDLLILLSALAWAISVVILRPSMAVIRPISMYTMSLMGAAPVVLIYGLLPALHTDWAYLSGWVLVNFAQITLLSGVVGFAFFYKGVAELGASNASFYQFLVPPITVFFAFLIRHETLKPIQGVGLIVLLAGLMLTRGTGANQSIRPAPGTQSA